MKTTTTQHHSSTTRSHRFLLTCLLVLCGLFSQSADAAEARFAPHRRAQEDEGRQQLRRKLQGGFSNETVSPSFDLVNDETQDMKLDKEHVIIIGGVTGGVLAVTAPVILTALYLNQNVHRIASEIEFVLPTSVDLREPSFTEFFEVILATEAFYTSVLTASVGGGFEGLTLARKRIVKYDNPNLLTDIVDAITSNNDRIYGYTLKFDMLVKVTNVNDLTIGEILTELLAANMDLFLSGFINPIPVNIIAEATSAKYIDRVRGW